MQGSTTGDGAGSVKNESANGGIKSVTVLCHEKVTAVHGPAGCAKSAAAGVLEGFSRAQQRLLTDHAQAFDFLAQTGEISREYGRGNAVGRRHGLIVAVTCAHVRPHRSN